MGLSETLNSLFADWTGVIKAFASLAAITLILVVAIVTKLAWGKLLITTMVAAFVIWAVTMNGLGFFSDTIDRELAPATPTTSSIAPVVPGPSVAV